MAAAQPKAAAAAADDTTEQLCAPFSNMTIRGGPAEDALAKLAEQREREWKALISDPLTRGIATLGLLEATVLSRKGDPLAELYNKEQDYSHLSVFCGLKETGSQLGSAPLEPRIHKASWLDCSEQPPKELKLNVVRAIGISPQGYAAVLAYPPGCTDKDNVQLWVMNTNTGILVYEPVPILFKRAKANEYFVNIEYSTVTIAERVGPAHTTVWVYEIDEKQQAQLPPLMTDVQWIACNGSSLLYIDANSTLMHGPLMGPMRPLTLNVPDDEPAPATDDTAAAAAPAVNPVSGELLEPVAPPKRANRQMRLSRVFYSETQYTDFAITTEHGRYTVFGSVGEDGYVRYETIETADHMPVVGKLGIARLPPVEQPIVVCYRTVHTLGEQIQGIPKPDELSIAGASAAPEEAETGAGAIEHMDRVLAVAGPTRCAYHAMPSRNEFVVDQYRFGVSGVPWCAIAAAAHYIAAASEKGTLAIVNRSVCRPVQYELDFVDLQQLTNFVPPVRRMCARALALLCMGTQGHLCVVK